MKKAKAIFSTFILCFLFWILFTFSGKVDFQEIIVGIAVSIIVAVFAHKFLVKEEPFWIFNLKRILSFIEFIPVYFVELIKANIDVALRALSPNLNIKPGIVKIQTDLESDYGLAMLSNCITLTPGTITMDIVEENNKNYLYIHWINVTSKDIKTSSNLIKGAFEPWIRRIFK